MTTATAPAITVLRTSQRGALLITDNVRVAWVQGRTRRADGTFTPSALTALAEGKPYAEWEQEQAVREQEYAERKAAREQQYQEGKALASVTIPAFRVREGSEKSWKVRTNLTEHRYGKQVFVWEYFPKSVVKVSIDNGVATLTMPKWLLDKNTWLYVTI